LPNFCPESIREVSLKQLEEKMRKLFLFFFILFINCLLFADLTEGLIGYYPFNGNAEDESGNENHGIIHEVLLTTDRFDNTDTAYFFDGIDGWIKILDTPQFIVSDFTVAAWIRWDGEADNYYNHAIISNYSGSGSAYQHFGLRMAGEIVEMNGESQFFYDDGSEWDVVFGTSYINDGNWHLITGTITAGVSAKIYVDGDFESLDQTSIPENIDPTNDIYIGRDGFTESQLRWHGKIDDVRIYNRVLSDEEISELYHLCSWMNNPENITINIVDNSVEINWSAVIGATSYNVYSSEDPYGIFALEPLGTGIVETLWIEDISENVKYYQIRAVN